MRRANWTRILVFTLVGCGAVVALVGVTGAATAIWAIGEASRIGAPEPVSLARTMTAGPQIPSTSLQDVSRHEPLRVEVELQDGAFDIVPGPPGSEITVSGTYARNYYELIEEHHLADAGHGPGISIRLRPTRSALVRLAAAFRARNEPSETSNQLVLTIPTGRPIDLAVQISRGESQIDLGSLTLVNLDVDLSMGDHRVLFTEPLADELPQMSIAGRMGNIELDHLGNARPRQLRTSSRMGSFTLDLSGAWSTDHVADVWITHSMGDLRLHLPSTINLAADSEQVVTFGEPVPLPRDVGPDAIDAPRIRLHLSTTMGDTRISRS